MAKSRAKNVKRSKKLKIEKNRRKKLSEEYNERTYKIPINVLCWIGLLVLCVVYILMLWGATESLSWLLGWK